MSDSTLTDSTDLPSGDWMPVSICMASGLFLATLSVLHAFTFLQTPTTSTATSAAYSIAAISLLLLAWLWPRFRRADVDDFSGILAALILTAANLWPAVFEGGQINITGVALGIVAAGFLVRQLARLAPVLITIIVISGVAVISTVGADRSALLAAAFWGLAGLLSINARQWRQNAHDSQREIARQSAAGTQTHAHLMEKMEQHLQDRRRLDKQVSELKQQLEKSRRVDALTGLANRQQFHEMFAREFRRSQREQQPISLLFCDIDAFKQYNRRAGNDAGDRLLQTVAGLITDTIGRPTDVVARYEGTVFAIVLPNTDVAQSRLVANRIRDHIMETAIPHPTSPISRQVTVSIGVSSVVPYSDLSPERLMSLAAAALKDAKEQGRNRVTVEAISAVDEIDDAKESRRRGNDPLN